VWWKALAGLINRPHDYVVFSIDGLEDTNHIYRRGVDWRRLMANVETFILAGGRAQWDMLVYRHNQHQVDQCEQMAKDMGFSVFRAKVSRRPLIDNLQYPVGWQKPFSHTTNIQCHALDEQSIYIDAQGRLWPCCFLANDLSSPPSFDQIQQSWTSSQPNATCSKSCGKSANQTMFLDQWQKQTNFNN
jgi:sulfatase maturation enzyme AslB (radical SAM superfamily)